MSGKIWFVVPAAGASRRLGSGVPKQYLLLNDRTVLEHCLERLLQHPAVSGGVVVLAADDRHWPRLPEDLRHRVGTATGGQERCHSVLAGLVALSQAAAGDWVLVHDAARPCVPAADIARLVDACCNDAVGGLLALPLADTLKRGDDQGRVMTTVPRDSLWRALTPQMFRYGLLREALESALAAGDLPGDEAAAIERLGRRPLLVEGSAVNIKITRAEDMAFAAAVLAARGEPAG